MPNTPEQTFLGWWDCAEKLEALALAYLRTDYDSLIYVVRGGMTPAHRLAHVLGLPSGPEAIKPLYLRRHHDDGVQAAAHAVEGDRPPEGLEPGMRLLLVEDTVGAGATLERALAILNARQPALVDVVSVGFDHHDWLAARPGEALAEQVARAAIGFDYWGWMVFPWERQARRAEEAPRGSEPLPLLGPVPAGRGAALPIWLRQADQPGQTIASIGPGLPAGWQPAHAHWQALEADRLADAAAWAPASAHLIIVGGAIASRLPLAHWTAYGQLLARALAPGGRLVFDFLDRRLVTGPGDLLPGWEYATPALAARLLERWGLLPAESFPGGRLVGIASGRRPDRAPLALHGS